jgi:hypothetical protein
MNVGLSTDAGEERKEEERGRDFKKREMLVCYNEIN